MREILFRGKRVDTGEWIYGYYIGQHKYDASHEICDVNDCACTRFDVDPDTVGQFTGLRDKNGVRIFEGDVIQYPIEQGKFRGDNLHQVVFEQRGGSAYFGIIMNGIETWQFCMAVPAKLMCVVGNIYDIKAGD